MSYFPHAFQKTLLGTAGILHTAATAGQSLAAAKVAVMDPKTNQSVDLTDLTIDIKDLPMIWLSQGSLHTADKIGPYAGGFKESVKSKGINPRYVSKFWKHEGHAAQAHIMDIKMCDSAGTLTCGTTYDLRVDVKGSPALRFLTRNLYHTFSAYTGCCPADPEQDQTVKPWTVLEQWALGIAQNTLFQPFVGVKLVYHWTTSGAVTTTTAVSIPSTIVDLAAIEALRPAGFTTGTNTLAEVTLRLTGAYAETKFGNCSFDPRDAYEMEPLYIYLSAVDDKGDPCVSTGFCTTETQKAFQATNTGETILRKKLLADSYLEATDTWSRDARLREVIDGNVNFSYIDRTKVDYVSYYILHNVPRRSNPDSTMDNDQYLIEVVVAAEDTVFEDWFQAYLDLAGNGVVMETTTIVP